MVSRRAATTPRCCSFAATPDSEPRTLVTTPAGLDIDVTTKGTTTVVSPHGEIDYGNVDVLRAALADVSRADSDEVVVDLSHVTFIDSTALRALVGAKQRLADAGRSFSVRGPQPRVARVLQLAGVNEYLGGS